MKISVIVPVYNTGLVLERTVSSLLNQSFDDFEVLLIDDGSTDTETLRILEEYDGISNKIRVFHKKNGGVCEARNFGIGHARGEYITFCDHDDLFTPKTLEVEYQRIMDTNTEILFVGKETRYKENVTKHSLSLEITPQNFADKFLKLYNSGVITTIWNAIYKRELIGDTSFDTRTRKGYEDIKFNLYMIQKAKKIVCINDVLYIHLVTDEMSTSARLHPELVEQMINNNNLLYEIIEKYNIDYNCQDYVIAQGGQIQNCLIYKLKLDNDYSSYRLLINQLKVHRTKKLFMHRNNIREIFTYYAFSHECYGIIYWVMRKYIKVKKA